MNHQEIFLVLFNVIDTMKISLYDLTFLSRTKKRFTYISVIFRNAFLHFSTQIFMGFSKCPPFLFWTIGEMTICRKLSGTCFVGHPKFYFYHLYCGSAVLNVGRDGTNVFGQDRYRKIRLIKVHCETEKEWSLIHGMRLD